MSEEDKKLLLEMKSNCLEDRGTSRITYNDEKRIKKAKAIDNALKEIERLNKRTLTLEETIKKANNNVLKDIAMVKTHEMIKQEIVQRLIETSKILESGSEK